MALDVLHARRRLERLLNDVGASAAILMVLDGDVLRPAVGVGPIDEWLDTTNDVNGSSLNAKALRTGGPVKARGDMVTGPSSVLVVPVPERGTLEVITFDPAFEYDAARITLVEAAASDLRA